MILFLFEAYEAVLNDPNYAEQHTTVQALLVAATSERITLGGVFFILRRQPDALKKLLLSCASGIIMTARNPPA